MTSLPDGMLNDASVLSLRCFVAVVETNSFSSAARQLRLAPSSATKHIQALERALSVALVHRTTRHISVTDAGGRFYDQCLAILAQIDSATAVMQSAREITGHLRITAPPSFAAMVLAPNIHRFIADNPGVSLDVIVTSATPDLIRERVDVAVVVHDEPESKLAHVLLAASPQILCAAPSYVARFGLPETPEDLHKHECLSGRYSEVARGWVLRMNHLWQTYNVRCRLLSDNGDFLRQACINGAGIGLFYCFLVRADLQEGRLVQVLPNYLPKHRNLYAITPHRS